MRINILKPIFSNFHLPERQYLIPALGFYVSVIALAILYGLLATINNAIFIALGAGFLIGMALLFSPRWNIWLVLILGLFVAGLLPLYLSAFSSKAAWGVSLLGFIVLASALLRLITHPECSKNTPAFIWLTLAFMLYAIFDSLLQWNSAGEIVTGFKRYFQAFGLIFIFSWLLINAKEIQRWQKLVLFVALVQLPFAVYQLIVYVPMRESVSAYTPGLVPIDVVSGTFGATPLGGGNNAQMATFLLIAFAFLVARKREGALSTKRLLGLGIIILAPIFLGETKITVVLLPLIFLVLYRKELIAKPHKAIIGGAIVTLLTVGAGYSYLQIMQKDLHEGIETTLSYNFYEQGYGGFALNRTTVLSFWAQQQEKHGPVSIMFGNGLGSAHEGTRGHIAQHYSGYGVGLTAASTLLWELGIIGTLLFLSIFVYAWRCANQIQKRTIDPIIKADTQGIQVALAVFAFYLIYRSSLLDLLSFQIIFALILGYLAWLHNNVEKEQTGE
ncbi:hypothetical protein ACFL2V_05145 [Pseudomonadota bacterium]